MPKEPYGDLRPTKTFYIEPHYKSAKNVKICDITALTTKPVGEGYRSHALDVGKSAVNSLPASLTIHRATRLAPKFTVKSGYDIELAAWSETLLGVRTVRIHFTVPAGLAHCSHDIELRTKSSVFIKEKFVAESVEYVWQRRIWPRMTLVLEKCLPGRRLCVAQYWRPTLHFKRSGVLLVDTREVDHVVALLTMYVMLRKMNRRKKHG
jgi:hypothetical protein